MARIVHPGRDLVGEQGAAARDEELDREHPDIVERLGDPRRQRSRLLVDRRGDARRNARGAEDAVLVLVLHGVERGRRAVMGARDHHRNLALEIDALFEDRAARAQLPPGGLRVGAGADFPLALAVVSEPRGLEDRGCADIVHRPAEIGGGRDRSETGRGDADRVEKGLLLHPVLGDGERPRVRADRNRLREPLDRRGRNVLEFERDDVDGICEPGERGLVPIIRACRERRDLGGGGVRFGAVDVAAIAQPRRRRRDHPAELAAAQDADHRTRRQARRRARHVSPPDRRGRPGRRPSGASASPPAVPRARDRAGPAPRPRAAPR